MISIIGYVYANANANANANVVIILQLKISNLLITYTSLFAVAVAIEKITILLSVKRQIRGKQLIVLRGILSIYVYAVVAIHIS